MAVAEYPKWLAGPKGKTYVATSETDETRMLMEWGQCPREHHEGQEGQVVHLIRPTTRLEVRPRSREERPAPTTMR
mgnify:CR=1 FL=1